MQLDQLHNEVDEKLVNIEAEIQRFHSNIKACDDGEQRKLLEQDLATLETIRDKLIKARQITQRVTDLRHEVENPGGDKALIAGVPRWFLAVALVAAAGILAWWSVSV